MPPDDEQAEVYAVYLRSAHLERLAHLAQHLITAIDGLGFDGHLPDGIRRDRAEVAGALARLHAARERGPTHR